MFQANRELLAVLYFTVPPFYLSTHLSTFFNYIIVKITSLHKPAASPATLRFSFFKAYIILLMLEITSNIGSIIARMMLPIVMPRNPMRKGSSILLRRLTMSSASAS